MSSTKEDDRELSFTPAYELAEMIKSKRLSPVELAEVILKRIREINTKLNAYLSVAEDEAMRSQCFSFPMDSSLRNIPMR